MADKKFILNADDFGMSSAYNTAVLEGYGKGLLKSTSLTPNGEAFEQAVDKIIPKCPDLGIGVHLNIIEGKSLCKELEELTDVNGIFKNSYLKLILKSYSLNNTKFMNELEREFRAQIEKVKDAGIKITHIDSHVHTHAIPPIFELVCRLAKEYGIKEVRTQREKLYFVPDIAVHFQKKYFVNLIKIALLAVFSHINRPVVKRFGLNTNDYLLGVGYTSMMDNLTIFSGLKILENKSGIVAEALIHPCRYEDGTIDNHFTEYRITQNEKLKENIESLGYEVANYSE